MNDKLFGLSLHLAILSLSAIGGGVVLVAPDIHDYVAVRNHWLTSEQFSAMYALAQAAPGPNVLFITLIGWLIDGWQGALAATVAVIVPSSLLALGAARVVRGRAAADAASAAGGVGEVGGARAEGGARGGGRGGAIGASAGAARWSGALRAALAPLSAGMLAAAAWSFLNMSNAGALAIGLALACAAAVYATKINPIWLIAIGALAGAAGLV